MSKWIYISEIKSPQGMIIDLSSLMQICSNIFPTEEC